MAWLEVADPFCKYLKDGKCSVTGESIDNPYDKCVNPLPKCKYSNSNPESDLETPEDHLYFDTTPEHLRLDIDVPEDCARCVFGEEGGYCCALTGGEVCTRAEGRQVWCPFDNDGTTITAPGVKIVKDICL